MEKNNTQQFWNKYCKEYDSHMEETSHYSAQEKILTLLSNYLEEPILDLACGAGFLLGVLSEKFSELFANDFSQKMVKITKEKYGLPTTTNNAENLESYENEFKTIISCNLFFYIKNRNKAVKRWKDLLEKSGKIIFIEEYPFIKPKKGNLNKLSSQLMELINPISPDEIEKIMSRNGFLLLKKVKTKIDNGHNLYGLVFSNK